MALGWETALGGRIGARLTNEKGRRNDLWNLAQN
jgi:hypothetical protein